MKLINRIIKTILIAWTEVRFFFAFFANKESYFLTHDDFCPKCKGKLPKQKDAHNFGLCEKCFNSLSIEAKLAQARKKCKETDDIFDVPLLMPRITDIEDRILEESNIDPVQYRTRIEAEKLRKERENKLNNILNYKNGHAAHLGGLVCGFGMAHYWKKKGKLFKYSM